ncbi:STY0301 family protein [Duganella sp. Root336D2]|uniref:STY0301 family protein n=1 Tax=unclassified Duganella TaxID=2636909 RepID=UPI0035A38E51
MRPLTKDGIQYWAFGEPIEQREMWMRCDYARSSLSLSKRIRSDTTLCFQRSELAQTRSGRGKVVVTCVDSTHQANKTLRPYRSR